MSIVTYEMACDSLNDLIKIILARPDYKYLVRIHIDPYEGDHQIQYTIVLESRTHKCIEIRRFTVNFITDNFLERCSSNIIHMESDIAEVEPQAGIKAL